MPGATFRYTTTRVEQIQDDLGISFLEWQAETDSAWIRDGADSFVIQGAEFSFRPFTTPSSRARSQHGERARRDEQTPRSRAPH
jgi:hypothetical protein